MPLRCSVLHLIMRRPSAQRLSVVFLKPSLTTDTKTSSLCCVRGRNAVTGAGLPFTDLRCLPIVERKVLLQMQGIVCLVSGPRGVILSHGRVCSSVSSPIWGLWWPWSGRSCYTDVRHRLLGVWAERSNAVPRTGLLFRLLPIRGICRSWSGRSYCRSKAPSALCLGREEQCCSTGGSAPPFFTDLRCLLIVERQVLTVADSTGRSTNR